MVDFVLSSIALSLCHVAELHVTNYCVNLPVILNYLLTNWVMNEFEEMITLDIDMVIDMCD